jgi:hypothetical protein
VNTVVADLLAQSQGTLALRMTAIFFLVTMRLLFVWHPLSLVAAVLAVLMLLSPRLLESRWAWGGILAALAWGLIARWPISENNRYLDAYWVLACCLAAGFPALERDRLLAHNGRILIGLTFTLAAAQKALRGEYFDGSFMHGLFLWDDRFRTVAKLAGGLDGQDILANIHLKSAMSLMPSAVESIALVTSDQLRIVALGLGYFVLALEAAVGLSFLLSSPRWFAQLRHGLLFLFVLPTYLLAQVSHFGMILTVMGFAQCPPEWPRLRVLYLLVFVFLCFTDLTGPMLMAAVSGR